MTGNGAVVTGKILDPSKTLLKTFFRENENDEIQDCLK